MKKINFPKGQYFIQNRLEVFLNELEEIKQQMGQNY
jgi:hypothetical protein